MLWIVRDTCWECPGETIAVFDNEKDARSLCHAYPWLSWDEVETSELLGVNEDHAANNRYLEWFNNRTDRVLRERARDCE